MEVRIRLSATLLRNATLSKGGRVRTEGNGRAHPLMASESLMSPPPTVFTFTLDRMSRESPLSTLLRTFPPKVANLERAKLRKCAGTKKKHRTASHRQMTGCHLGCKP
jgi:hypothetical protein